MKRTLRLLGSILAIGTLITSQTLLPPIQPVQAAVGQLCATPGKDGAIGTLTGVVNTYYPGNGTASAGATSISVGVSTPTTGTAIAAGDLLLVIQMQDATINSTNTDAYGDGVGGDVPPPLVAGGTPPSNGASGSTGGTAGTFEYVVASAVSGGTITIRGKGTNGGLLNTYRSAAATTTQGQQTYQVIRVPQYATATLGAATALAWNGTIGGILAYDVAGNLNLTGTSSVNGLGFRGGAGRRFGGDTSFANTDYRTLAPNTAVSINSVGANGSKGEGIAGTPRYLYNGTATAFNTGIEGYPNGSYGRGAPGNAGGGSTDGRPNAAPPSGNDQNSGGGGGSNGGPGGIGGRSWSTNLPTGGFGGKPFPATNSLLVLGGGGGAGTTNNGTSSPNTNTTGINSSGAAGGGMVMIRTNTVSNSGTINATGANALNVANDGAGGGGAGGSVLVAALSNDLTGLTVNVDGGKGGNAVFGESHGPGGGGGGGVIVSNPGANFSYLGGLSGFTGNPATSITHGAAAGLGGPIPLAVGTIPGADPGAACVPKLTVTKTTSTAIVTNLPTGTTATYTITVSNEINRITATNVSISDALPAGFTYATLGTVALNGNATRTTTNNPTAGATNPSFGTFIIPGGGSVAITFTVNIASTVADNTYQNPATATYTDPALTTGTTTTSSYTATSSTAEDVMVSIPPNLLLVKRITAVNGLDISGFQDGVDIPTTDPNFVGTAKALDDNNTLWPTPNTTSLRGAINSSTITPAINLKPGDEVEYTIYFLNNGAKQANNVSICDFVPAKQTYVGTGYNGASLSADAGGFAGANYGIVILSANGAAPVKATNASDGDRSQFHSSGFPNSCIGTNSGRGAVVVNIGNVPKATSSNAPANSYGFIRFKAKID